MQRALLICLTALATAAVFGADAFEAERDRVASANPAGVFFALSLQEDRREFRMGETVGIRLAFSSNREGAYILNGATYDRSGRQHVEDYFVSPPSGVVDPVADYFFSGIAGGSAGGLRGHPELGSEPIELDYDLNEWVRFESPGRYRIYVVSHRLSRMESREPAGPIASNAIEIEVLPRDAAWERLQIERAVEVLQGCSADKSPLSLLGLAGPLPPDREREVRAAARALRFLGSQAAVEAVIANWGSCSGRFDLDFTLALVGAVDRAAVRRRLDAALVDPGMGVEASDLVLMAILEGAEQPDWQISQLARPATAMPGIMERLETRRKRHDRRLRRYAEKLALALPDKEPGAARFSLRAIEAFAPDKARELAHLGEEPTPSVAQWDELPIQERLSWLGPGPKWERLDPQQMLPVVRRIVAERPPAPSRDGTGVIERILWEQAAVRLNELAPDEARTVFIEEALRRDSLLGRRSKLLDLLPATLPEASERLADNLEADPSGSAHLPAALADESVFERVEAVYLRRAGRWDCEMNEMLLGYLLRARPVEGAAHVREALGAREQTKCYQGLLSAMARRYRGPEFTALAEEFLADPEIGENAAIALRLPAAPAKDDPYRALRLRPLP